MIILLASITGSLGGLGVFYALTGKSHKDLVRALAFTGAAFVGLLVLSYLTGIPIR